MLQVVPPEDVFDLVDRTTTAGASVFAERRQSALLLDNRSRHVDDLELLDMLGGGDAVAEQPQSLILTRHCFNSNSESCSVVGSFCV